MFYCLQCSIDHIVFSRVLCNRSSWLFRCHPLMPPDTPYAPSGLCDAPPHHYPSTGIQWSRVVLLQVSMTFGQPVGQANVWSDVPLTPITPCGHLVPPQVEASGGQEWCKLVSHWPELMFYCLQCSIDHLEFQKYTPPPVQAPSAH